MSYRLLGEGVMASPDALKALAGLEAAIFDCDGTLIETTESYDLAIKLTVEILLRNLCGLEIELGRDLKQAISSLRLLGGFNNDWDTAAVILEAIYLQALTSGESPTLRGLGKIETPQPSAGSGESKPSYAREGLKWVEKASQEIERRPVGRADLEEKLSELASRRGLLEKLEELRESLGLRGSMSYGSSVLATLFDEVYLGEEGVREKYGAPPRYLSWEGAITNEKPLVSEGCLEELSQMLKKGLGLVTGRGRWETERTLGPLMRFFNPKACVFIADLRRPELEKPSPKPLLAAAEALGAESVVYVGNSAEDLLMARNAAAAGLKALFAGVASDDESLQYFMESSADIILEDVNSLPKALEVVAAWWM